MKRCETSKVLLEWILPVHLRFQWLLDYLRKTEVSSNRDAKIQSDRNSQQELSDSSSSRIPSTPTGLIAWKINMACCHCEALQRRQRLLGGNVATENCSVHLWCGCMCLGFGVTNCQPLPILGFQTHLQQWSKKPSQPAFSAAVSAVVKVGTSTRLFAWRRSSQLPLKIVQSYSSYSSWKKPSTSCTCERGLSMFIPLKFFPSWPSCILWVSSAFRWKQQPCHLWEMIIQFRGPSWEVGFS